MANGKAGDKIKGFFSAIFQPTAGLVKDISGETVTVEKTAPDATKGRTATIGIVVLAVVALAVVAYILLKPKATA